MTGCGPSTSPENFRAPYLTISSSKHGGSAFSSNQAITNAVETVPSHYISLLSGQAGAASTLTRAHGNTELILRATKCRSARLSFLTVPSASSVRVQQHVIPLLKGATFWRTLFRKTVRDSPYIAFSMIGLCALVGSAFAGSRVGAALSESPMPKQ